MAYRIVANNRGGYHVSDDETLEHGEVKDQEEAREWFAAQDAKKLAEYEAQNAAPKPGEQPVNVSTVNSVSDIAREN